MTNFANEFLGFAQAFQQGLDTGSQLGLRKRQSAIMDKQSQLLDEEVRKSNQTRQAEEIEAGAWKETMGAIPTGQPGTKLEVGGGGKDETSKVPEGALPLQGQPPGVATAVATPDPKIWQVAVDGLRKIFSSGGQLPPGTEQIPPAQADQSGMGAMQPIGTTPMEALPTPGGQAVDPLVAETKRLYTGEGLPSAQATKLAVMSVVPEAGKNGKFTAGDWDRFMTTTYGRLMEAGNPRAAEEFMGRTMQTMMSLTVRPLQMAMLKMGSGDLAGAARMIEEHHQFTADGLQAKVTAGPNKTLQVTMFDETTGQQIGEAQPYTQEDLAMAITSLSQPDKFVELTIGRRAEIRLDKVADANIANDNARTDIARQGLVLQEKEAGALAAHRADQIAVQREGLELERGRNEAYGDYLEEQGAIERENAITSRISALGNFAEGMRPKGGTTTSGGPKLSDLRDMDGDAMEAAQAVQLPEDFPDRDQAMIDIQRGAQLIHRESQGQIPATIAAQAAQILKVNPEQMITKDLGGRKVYAVPTTAGLVPVPGSLGRQIEADLATRDAEAERRRVDEETRAQQRGANQRAIQERQEQQGPSAIEAARKRNFPAALPTFEPPQPLWAPR